MDILLWDRAWRAAGYKTKILLPIDSCPLGSRIVKHADRPDHIEKKYAAGVEYSQGSDKMFPNNCAIIERTADGVSVGPCTFYLENGTTCPRHGKVKC